MTYTYDGTDANGLAERRGLPTKLVVTNPDGSLTMTAAYNPAGDVVLETFPGNLERETAYDHGGWE